MFNLYKPNEIYNLAAQSSVGLSFTQPIGTLQYNIVSVLNLLESIRIVSPNTRFYQASSSEMYGMVKELPVNISTPMHPLSPYAISKCTAYWIVVNYRESYGLHASNGVLFNHESFLRTNTFFVKKVISNAVLNRHNINWQLEVGNIDVKRDFGYSPKYVEAMWLMLQTEKPDDFIIATGKTSTLEDFVELAFGNFNLNWKEHVIRDKELFRPSDIAVSKADPQKAINVLGWKAKYHLKDIVEKMIKDEIY
mgnify:CR=1 FL=1